MWHIKFRTDFDMSKKRSKLGAESSRNCQKKKKSKILKISKFFKIFKKTFIYSQKKYNFFDCQGYSLFSSISETLQILTSKFGFTVALKPQRNWKNSKIVHFPHMDPHRYRSVGDSPIPIMWDVLEVQHSMLKKIWDFLLRATKFSAQIWKTLIFKKIT